MKQAPGRLTPERAAGAGLQHHQALLLLFSLYLCVRPLLKPFEDWGATSASLHLPHLPLPQAEVL